jgi:hypothetical protein
VVFPKSAGGKQRLRTDRIEFVGYGLDAPAAGHTTLQDRKVSGATVVWLGTHGPRDVDASLYRRGLTYRSQHATEELRALAALGPETEESQRAAVDEFVAIGRLDAPRPPAVAVTDSVFEFLFRNAPAKYADLKRRADAREPLPSFRLDDVSITFNIDVEYEILRTQLTHNVVGIVEGTDPQLKSTYVAFGAHYDHVGYAEPSSGPPPHGRVTSGVPDDRIWNGADDDASGSAALMALARAFAAGPRPRRSTLFVWHAGEELGNYGSRHFTDYPPVPVESIVAQLNVDMIGRNRDDLVSEANTVYLVGSDRISTELHDISRAANAAMSAPLKLDYELNDPTDPEQMYYRSDHYSYALKGIPVIFFTTGLHPDYHTNTDEVSKILFDKMTRIAHLIYETGVRLANLDHAPARDWRGPRSGKGSP